MRGWSWTGVLAALVVFVFPAYGAEKTDLTTLMVAFDQMVLRDQGRVSKWLPRAAPLKLKVTAQFGEAELGILEAALRAVSDNTKIQFERDDGASSPEILIETQVDLGSQAVGSHNIGLTNSQWGSIGAEMRRATIGILKTWYRVDPYRIRRTLPHELLHAVGFHGHPMNFDSVMSVHGVRYGMSDWDLLFLRVLYDPKIPVGTPRVIALPIVCRTLHARLIAENNPDVTDINRSGEHPYCAELAKRPIDAKTANEQMRTAGPTFKALAFPRISTRRKRG